mmetsp:Transcript_5883/g.16556  ORF Transcript_5883/g.16556 Transcript_5883/m.16556 type:complete len:224 (+) Transcript_5883:476-1147(+)
MPQPFFSTRLKSCTSNRSDPRCLANLIPRFTTLSRKSSAIRSKCSSASGSRVYDGSMDARMDWSFCPTNGAMCGPAGGGTGCDGTASTADGVAGTIDGAFVNRASPAWGVAVLRAAAAAAAARFCASSCARALSAAQGEPLVVLPEPAAAPVAPGGEADGGDILWAIAAKFLPLGLPPGPPAEAAEGDPAGGVLGPVPAAPAAAAGLFLPPGGVDARCCAWSG